MKKTKKVNQGFSLIELLIAMTILSIVMIMIVSFMSTTSAAYRKTKKNLNIQTESMKVLEQLSDTIMQAKYIRIVTKDEGMYTVKVDTSSGSSERMVQEVTLTTPVTYDFVPDNYGNYAKNCDMQEMDERKVIVDFSTFEIVDEDDNNYPLSSDTDVASGTNVRSARALKPAGTYNYIKPEYIYAEYLKEKDDGSIVTEHVLFHITDIVDQVDKTCSIYMCRAESSGTTVIGLKSMIDTMENMLGKSQTVAVRESADATVFTANTESAVTLQKIDAGVDGLVTDKVSDFYLSADVEGNSLLTNILFKDDSFEYNVAETINFRNSNVLTVRPQKLYKALP